MHEIALAMRDGRPERTCGCDAPVAARERCEMQKLHDGSPRDFFPETRGCCGENRPASSAVVVVVVVTVAREGGRERDAVGNNSTCSAWASTGARCPPLGKTNFPCGRHDGVRAPNETGRDGHEGSARRVSCCWAGCSARHPSRPSAEAGLCLSATWGKSRCIFGFQNW